MNVFAHRSTWRYFSAWIILFGALVVGILSVAKLSLSTVLLALISLVIIIPMAHRNNKRQLDLFEPIVTANFALGVMFVARPLSILITGQVIHIGYNVMPTFNKALGLALLAIVSLQIGYYGRLGPRLSHRIPKPPLFKVNKASMVAWFYVLLGCILFGTFLSTQDGFSTLVKLLRGRGAADDNILFLSTTAYLYQGILLWAVSALIFFAISLYTGKRRYILLSVLLSLLLIIYYGSRGARSQLLPLFIGLPLFWYLWHGRKPQLFRLILVLMVSFSLLGWQREIRNEDAEARRAPLRSLLKSVASPWTEALDILTSADTEMFDTLTNFLLVVPGEISFRPGTIIRDVFIRAVPRTFWHNKPGEGGAEAYDTLWPGRRGASRMGASSSLVGYLYFDMGPFTVAVGMIVLGIALSMIWHWFLLYPNSVVAQLIYAMVPSFTIILLRGNIPDTLGRALFLVTPLFVLSLFLRIRR